MIPTWLAYLLGALVAVVLATVLAPVFPAPLSTLLFWGGWIAALVLTVLAVVALVRGSARPIG